MTKTEAWKKEQESGKPNLNGYGEAYRNAAEAVKKEEKNGTIPEKIFTAICKIQWVDAKGNPTPDENQAIGIAHIFEDGYTMVEGRRIFTEPRSFPICADHLKLMPASEWRFEPFARG